MRTIILLLFAAILSAGSYGQASSKETSNFGSPIITDSSSTILIPTVYDAKLFSSNKLALWGDYYSNVIFYDFKTDSSKKLFPQNTYITNLSRVNYSYYGDRRPAKSMTTHWILYRVMNVDRNNNGRIDGDDPAILYVSDTHGGQLRSLTSSNENVVSLDVYEKQNIAMIKIQRDQNNDNNFTSKDASYYYVKLDLTTLTFGKKIELD